jgi:hypothetical protein
MRIGRGNQDLSTPDPGYGAETVVSVIPKSKPLLMERRQVALGIEAQRKTSQEKVIPRWLLPNRFHDMNELKHAMFVEQTT